MQKTPRLAFSSRAALVRAALPSAVVARRSGPKRNGSAGSRGVAHKAAAVGDDQLLAAKVRLLESLINQVDVTDCTQYALRWLDEVLGLTPSLCLLRTDGGEALSTAGAQGFRGPAASRFAVSLADWNNPLVAAFSNGEDLLFRSAQSATDRKSRPSTPFEDAAFHVVPLFADESNRDAVGLLLIGGSGPKPHDVRWFTSLFARKLAQVLRQRASMEGDRELGRERSLLHNIINAVADPILITDTEGRLLIANLRALTLFSASEEDDEERRGAVRMNNMLLSSAIEGKGAGRRELLLVNPADGSELVYGLLSTQTEGPRQGGDVVSILRNVTDLRRASEEIEESERRSRIAGAEAREAIGEARSYEQLKQDSDELVRRIQAATSDITHQNELLRRQAIELERASTLKSQFLANMSHEFRTPLNAVLGYTSMLLQGVAGPLEPRARRHLSRVESNGRHLLRIISEILDISRIEAGRMPLQLARFDVPGLVAEVQSELEPIIQKSTLAFTVDLPEDLPQVMSDRRKVRQILLNLLGNALKFTHQGRITISARRNGRDRTIALSVADTGIGIAQADQERIFEDFRQLDDSPTRLYGGTGLGLSMCRRLAQMLGGGITLRSQLDKGFDVYARAAGQGTKMKGKGERPRILLVDDYPDAREMYAEYLEYSGFDVIEAANGMEALERAADSAPDVILMDLSLPVMDGWEATRRLKADKVTAEIPIVALTGHALGGILEGAKKAGCDAFVTKPCLPEELVKEIHRVLSPPTSSTTKAPRRRKRAKTSG